MMGVRLGGEFVGYKFRGEKNLYMPVQSPLRPSDMLGPAIDIRDERNP